MNLTHRFPPLVATGLLIALLAATTGCSCRPAAAEPPMPGRDLYGACLPCHGKNGAGNPTLAAPAIAGLPKWYVLNQLRKFRTGLRGAHPDDYEGLRMRPMSRQMASDLEVDTVATYVSELPPVPQAPVLQGGDAVAGKAAFGVCLACHGPDGRGNVLLNAPPIAGQADWYLLTQLKKFKGGIRGSLPGDVTGGQMRPMAMTLADEQAMKNVLAHISTLPR